VKNRCISPLRLIVGTKTTTEVCIGRCQSVYNTVGSMEMARPEGPNSEAQRAETRRVLREGYSPSHQLGGLAITSYSEELLGSLLSTKCYTVQ